MIQDKEYLFNFNSFMWVFRNLCLPLFIPYIIYKLLQKINYDKKRQLLFGKTVLITGASSGLGESLAHIFYAQGCKVVLAARREEELMRVKRDILEKNVTTTTFPPLILPMDLADINSLEGKVYKIYEEFGNIDILINNGGIGTRGNILDSLIQVDQAVMAVNYFGPVALTKAILPKMVESKSGHVVFVSSVQGLIAIPNRSSYAASKHAMQAFADTLRAEVHQHGIKVSVISPGYIQTALSLNAMTATGDKYGVTDKSTAKGFTPDFVAKKILNMVIKETKELTLSPLAPKAAIQIRHLIPSLYFWIMAKRAAVKE